MPEASPAHSLGNCGVAFGNSNDLAVICFGRGPCYELRRMKNKPIIKALCRSCATDIGILGGQEEHRREFTGFLKEGQNA